MNRKTVDIAAAAEEILSVNLDGCPLSPESRSPPLSQPIINICQDPPVSVIYSGTGNATLDVGLYPFTGQY